MAEFFARPRPSGGYGLALFLNAGDPPLPVLKDVVAMLDEEGIDCLELAVPFPDSVTDGATIRRSARRALDGGTDLDDVLGFVSQVRPTLRNLRIALLADWSHSIKGRPLRAVVDDIAASGADGVLLHAVPPRIRQDHYDAAAQAGLRVVTTCYHRVSKQQVMDEAAANATAYVYLVAQYGRTGAEVDFADSRLADGVAHLRARTSAPIAVGFGVRTRADAEAVASSGANAVIVGSAGVATIEAALADGRDLVADLAAFVASIRSPVQEFTT